MKVIMITGASSGIGREFARQLDQICPDIDAFWLIGRNERKLNETAELLRHHKTVTFALDLTKKEDLEILSESLEARHANVRMLVNAAGYGLMGKFKTQDREEALGMIRLNCEALTDLTHRVIPYMKPNARIIQMASAAAFVPQADFAVYAASKSYVLSFTRALGRELREDGIFVTAVCPGPVNTPFFDIAERTGTTLAIKKYTMVEAKEVVHLAIRDSLAGRSVSVCGIPMKAVRVLTKTLPHSFVLTIMDLMKKLGE